MKKSLFIKVLVAVASCAVLLSCGAKKQAVVEQKVEEKPLVLKVAHCNGEDHPYAAGLVAFKEKLEQLSGGKVTAELYHGTMGQSEKELDEKFNSGEVSIYVTAPNLVPIPEVELFSLEYLFNNNIHWETCMDGDFGLELSDIITQKTNNQYKILGYWSSGIRNCYANKAIKSPDDLKGMNIRVSSSPVQIEFWQACGVNTKSIGWGDPLDKALTDGEYNGEKIDGAENDYTSMMLKGHHKMQSGKFISETEHDITTRFFIMDGNLFDSFTPQQQNIITEAAQYATEIERQQTYELTSSSKATVIEEGATVTEADDIDMAAFHAIADPIQDKFAGEHGFEHFIELVRNAQ